MHATPGVHDIREFQEIWQADYGEAISVGGTEGASLEPWTQGSRPWTQDVLKSTHAPTRRVPAPMTASSPLYQRGRCRAVPCSGSGMTAASTAIPAIEPMPKTAM